MIEYKEIEKELIENSKFLKATNKGDNYIYMFSAEKSQILADEIGRLRESSFKNVGGGTNKDLDLDRYDKFFDQLVVWNPEYKMIIGGYRIQKLNLLSSLEQSPLHHFFEFSDDFMQDYLPYAVELGRSFIIPELQNSSSGIFALDNLFDAIGAWIAKYQEIKYLVGKITLYPNDSKGNTKDLSVVYELINKYFNSKSGLLNPRSEFKLDREFKESGNLSGEMKKDLNLLIRKFDAPPLLSVYAGLSPSMRTFGTVKHYEFGDVEETGMIINLQDVYPNIKQRYNL